MFCGCEVPTAIRDVLKSNKVMMWMSGPSLRVLRARLVFGERECDAQVCLENVIRSVLHSLSRPCVGGLSVSMPCNEFADCVGFLASFLKLIAQV